MTLEQRTPQQRKLANAKTEQRASGVATPVRNAPELYGVGGAAPGSWENTGGWSLRSHIPLPHPYNSTVGAGWGQVAFVPITVLQRRKRYGPGWERAIFVLGTIL